MMSPDRPVTIGGQTYTLDGSFRTLKAIQTVTGKDVLDVLVDAIQGKHRFDDLANLIRLGIEGSGQQAPDIAEIEQEIGIRQAAELVMEWLMAATSPKRDREGNVGSGLMRGIGCTGG